MHLVLFFFGQALALFASLVRGVDVGQAQQVVGGGAVELADGKQRVTREASSFPAPTHGQPRPKSQSYLQGFAACHHLTCGSSASRSPEHSFPTLLYLLVYVALLLSIKSGVNMLDMNKSSSIIPVQGETSEMMLLPPQR